MLSLNPSIKKEPFLNQLKFRKGYISFEIKGFLSNIPLILCIIFGVVWSITLELLFKVYIPGVKISPLISTLYVSTFSFAFFFFSVFVDFDITSSFVSLLLFSVITVTVIDNTNKININIPIIICFL